MQSIEEGSTMRNKMQLPNIVVVKWDMLVELIGGNFKVEDGLVNGAKGIFTH